MRFVPALLALTCCLFASPDKQAPDDQPVLAPIQAMFDGMTKRDPQLIRNPAMPGANMLLMRNGKPVQMTIEAFAERVGKPAPTHIAERIHDPLIRIDHNLALVWAPFDFLVDGKIDHCGTDSFTLILTDGKWLIASVADTSSNNCSGTK